MGCARNAGIVVAHRLLTFPCDLFGRPGRNLADEVPEILLDPFLILRSWRNNLCGSDEPVLIERVAMIKKSAGRFSGGLPGRSSPHYLGARCGWRLVFADHSQCLVAGKDQLDRSHHNAAEWIAAGRLQSTIACSL